MALNQILEPGMERFTADFNRVITLRGTFPVLWFLIALFIIDVIYNLANRYINSDKGFLFGVSIALCLVANVSNICLVPNYLIWQSICEGMVFYAFGAYMKAPNNVMRGFSIPACLATGIVTIIFAVISTGLPISVVDISQGQIGIPFLNVLVAFAGIYMVLNIFFLLEKIVDYMNWHIIKRLIILVGCNTIVFFPLMSYLPVFAEKYLKIIEGGANLLQDLFIKFISCLICFAYILLRDNLKKHKFSKKSK